MPVLADLLGAIAAAPNLSGALCSKYPDVFTATWGRAAGHPDVIARAITVCQHCPALAACRTWVEALPPDQRPPGVTAAVIRRAS